jgi:hypothetical protein
LIRELFHWLGKCSCRCDESKMLVMKGKLNGGKTLMKSNGIPSEACALDLIRLIDGYTCNCETGENVNYISWFLLTLAVEVLACRVSSPMSLVLCLVLRWLCEIII